MTVFGAALENVTVEDFCDPKLVYQIGVAPNRIDVMMDIRGVEFSSAWTRRVKSSYKGEFIDIISIDDLMTAKRTMDREQDRLDLKSLEQAKAIK